MALNNHRTRPAGHFYPSQPPNMSIATNNAKRHGFGPKTWVETSTAGVSTEFLPSRFDENTRGILTKTAKHKGKTQKMKHGSFYGQLMRIPALY